MTAEKYSIIIPAYNPGNELSELAKHLLTSTLSNIIIINDGSLSNHDPIFEELLQLSNRIIILEHNLNLGKGAALKTGLNYAYVNFKDDVGVVTADADGQHAVEDILKVSKALIQNPNSLILGTRNFPQDGKQIPLRSQFGNRLTIKLFQYLMGLKLNDTQSGLRGIPLDFIPSLLDINQNRYEFELRMLIECKLHHRNIKGIPIKTIYINNNKTSNFRPIVDSLKIYVVLFYFGFLARFQSFIKYLKIF